MDAQGLKITKLMNDSISMRSFLQKHERSSRFLVNQSSIYLKSSLIVFEAWKNNKDMIQIKGSSFSERNEQTDAYRSFPRVWGEFVEFLRYQTKCRHLMDQPT